MPTPYHSPIEYLVRTFGAFGFFCFATGLV